ncbi:MAG: Transposase zinc-ribbon protein [Edaphobacter sp.]|nr:Transposase zinc-ribbon protein [Edaphobacter sp.]
MVLRDVLDGLYLLRISAKQIQRETRVTYKTAWRMFNQIRKLMGNDAPLTGKKIEMDETYVGGKAKNKRLGKRGGARRSLGDKAPVFGMVPEKVLDKATLSTNEYCIYG